MTIPVNFAVDADLMAGLADGSLQRFGGVVRDSHGSIIRHLVEVSGRAATAAPPALGMVAVPPMALALGVGVVAAGFFFLGRRLKVVQEAVTRLDRRIQEGFARVDGRLDAVDQQLGYLVALAEHSQAQHAQLLEGLSELHRLNLLKEVADLQSVLQSTQRFPEDGPKEALRVAQRVRPLMFDQAMRSSPALDPQVMLRVDISVRAWMVATSTEAQILMQLGEYGEARQLVEEDQPQLQQLADRWAQTLLSVPGRPALGTAHRLSLTPSIPAERVARIARIHPADRGLTPGKQHDLRSEAELELSLSTNRQLREGWAPREEAIGEYLDGMSELNDRLLSLGALAADCERAGPSYYEALPGKDAAPGLYVISPPEPALSAPRPVG